MKKNNILLFITTSLLLLGCKKPLEYQYQDRPQLVDCPGIDKALLHEALYSFQEDIGKYYNKLSDLDPQSNQYYIAAYQKFVYFGYSGEAKFDEIVSAHSLQVLEELKKQKDLWNIGQGKSNLNYNSELVSCLFDHISDEDIQQTLKSLRQVDYLSPQVLANPMRQNVMKIVGDSYLATFTMLDAYYQYLLNYDLSVDAKDE